MCRGRSEVFGIARCHTRRRTNRLRRHHRHLATDLCSQGTRETNAQNDVELPGLQRAERTELHKLGNIRDFSLLLWVHAAQQGAVHPRAASQHGFALDIGCNADDMRRL